MDKGRVLKRRGNGGKIGITSVEDTSGDNTSTASPVNDTSAPVNDTSATPVLRRRRPFARAKDKKDNPTDVSNDSNSAPPVGTGYQLVPPDFRVKFRKEWSSVKRYSDDEVAMALVKCDGFIAKTANELGCTYPTLYHKIKRNKKLQELLKNVQEITLDFAESQLKRLIAQGDKTAIIFTLKCKGRQRGWIDTVDIAGVPDAPITFKYTLGGAKQAAVKTVIHKATAIVRKEEDADRPPIEIGQN